VRSAMPLRLPDHWLWDFWFAQDAGEVHVFYLQAPRSLGDPDLRHHHASVGHAVTRDLRRWRVLPDALGPGPPGGFDDLATWTGSILRRDGSWLMAYTGVSRAEHGRVQRVGLATSDDLTTWTRRGLALAADPRWYDDGPAPTGDVHWRDPWLALDEDGRRVHVLVTARARTGPADARGVIGHAWSDDLRTWEAGPPLSEPGEFAQLEVPQLVHVGGAWRILFCATPGDHGAARRGRAGVVAECGTHYLTAPERFGSYALSTDAFLAGDPVGHWYAGRLVRHGGAWHFFAWRLRDEHGAFVGELSDPMPVSVGTDGSLEVALPGPRTM
jgi:beta-fructofuranosidase